MRLTHLGLDGQWPKPTPLAASGTKLTGHPVQCMSAMEGTQHTSKRVAVLLSVDQESAPDVGGSSLCPSSEHSILKCLHEGSQMLYEVLRMDVAARGSRKLLT